MITLLKKIYACEMNSSGMMIINAMLWAAVMIASGIVLRGSEQSETIFWILFTAATTSFLLFQNYSSHKNKADSNNWL